jgi:hypothetical protein
VPWANDYRTRGTTSQVVGTGGFDGGICQRLTIVGADVFDSIELALHVINGDEPTCRFERSVAIAWHACGGPQ